jgi:iron complex transport system substrate-binding protein
MKRFTPLFVLFIVFLHGWAQAQSLALQDDRGVKVSFSAPPQRIVSLLPSLTECVCALKACDRLVGVDRYSNWPASVKALPQLGGLEDTPLERIVQLRPDVVLVAKSGRVIDRLEALGLKVLALESETHADVQRTLNILAALVGRPEAGPSRWAAIQQQVQQAAALVPAQVKGQSVYFEVSSVPYAAGQASFIGATLAQLGMRNVVPAELGAFPKLNPEFVLRAQPQWVMAHAREMRTLPARPGWSALTALQQGRSCSFEGPSWELLIRPGPRLGEAALALADCLRKK